MLRKFRASVMKLSSETKHMLDVFNDESNAYQTYVEVQSEAFMPSFHFPIHRTR